MSDRTKPHYNPAPASSLGNPEPLHGLGVAMPVELTERAGLVVDGRPGSVPVDLTGARKILVVRLDFIGDWVLTLPFMENLRLSAPEAEISVVVLNRVYDLARSCRWADRVIGTEAAESGPVTFQADDAEMLRSFVADYEGDGFDLALVPRWDTDFNGALRIADGSGASSVVGFSEHCTDHRASVNRGEDRYYSSVVHDVQGGHEVEHKLRFLEAIGGAVARQGIDLDLDPVAEKAAEEFIAGAFGAGTPFLAIAPFAVGRKGWPTDRTAALARRLSEAFDCPIAVVGSPAHGEDAEAFVRMVGGGAVSACGLRLSISASLIGKAAALIGMDSGPGHIAAALDTPVVTIFSHPKSGDPGHVGAPERFAPWGGRSLVLQPDRPLAPCVDGCEADEPHCILQLAVDGLFPEITRFASAYMREPVT